MAGRPTSKILPGFMMAPTFGSYGTRKLPGKQIGKNSRALLRSTTQPESQSEQRDRISLTERIFDILRR
jgi:hypothetical protein